MNNKKIEDLAVELRREYRRKWNRENKDKVRENNRRYWLRKAEKALKEKEMNSSGSGSLRTPTLFLLPTWSIRDGTHIRDSRAG